VDGVPKSPLEWIDSYIEYLNKMASFFAIEAGWNDERIGRTRKCKLEFYMNGWNLIKQDEKEAYEKEIGNSKNNPGQNPGGYKKTVREVDLMDMMDRKKEQKKPQSIAERKEQLRKNMPSPEKLAAMREDQKRRWGV